MMTIPMKTMTLSQVRAESLSVRQNIFHAPILIALCLCFLMIPAQSFGQPALGNIAGEGLLGFDDSPFAPQPATTIPEPAPAPAAPTRSELSTPALSFADSFAQPEASFAQPGAPAPTAAAATPVTASQYAMPIPTTNQQPLPLHNPQQTHLQRAVAVNADHPFRQYWGVPNDPQTTIAGKPMTVAELLTGTRSAVVRSQLLQAYWELGGLLAIYHFRYEAERLASGAMGQTQELMTLLSEQRRTAEVEFTKQQWVLAELLKLYKGRIIRETDLPIPADYPLYPRYQTFADKIARTERTQHLGRMIPIQEQLIESKNRTWRAASVMTPSASQPFFEIANQRTVAFLDLTSAIVEYNKMIAEYAMETIPVNVTQHQLVGAVIRLPRRDAVQEHPQTLQRPMEGIALAQYELPTAAMAEPVEQVGHEFQPNYQSPSLSLPEIAETAEPHLPPTAPPFLMDF